ncbi:MAG: AAA family ATPase, partial [Treponema sp.]|nr:AAA family ATPase [Treponema sp.]
MIEIPFYIPRTRYIEKIRPFSGSRIIKVLTGQRRTGKSYLFYQLMDEIRKQDEKANILYINTEFAEWRQIARAEDLYGYVRAKQVRGKHNYLFIDEIQEIERFEEAVKSLFAESRWDIYITGSNARLLSGELATYLA